MVHFALEAAVTELRFPHCPAQRAAGSSGPAEPAHRRGTTIAVGVVGDSHTPFLVTLNGSCQRPHKGRMSQLHQFPGEQAGHTPCACHGTRPIGATPKPSSKGPSCSQVRQPGGPGAGQGALSRSAVSGGSQWGQSVGGGARGLRPGSGEGGAWQRWHPSVRGGGTGGLGPWEVPPTPLGALAEGWQGAEAASVGPSKCDMDKTCGWNHLARSFSQESCATRVYGHVQRGF